MSTGRFNEKQNEYFNSIDGAYTTMTGAEVGKRTFNVKKAIKEIIEKYSGTDSIPRWSDAKKYMNFKISEKCTQFNNEEITLVCKYSKPNKNEVSIYFSTENGVPLELIKPNNKWFVYYKKDDEIPWIGIFSEEKWRDILIDDIMENDSDKIAYSNEEKKEKELKYNLDINTIICKKNTAPEKLNKNILNSKRVNIRKTDWETREKNQKIKGTIGEEIVLNYEKEKLLSYERPDLAKKVEWVAKNGDGHGYDIVSFDINSEGKETKIFIEVKTTSGNKQTPFIFSRNELDVSKEKKEQYCLFRIYNLRENCKSVDFYTKYGALDEVFEIEPLSYTIL